jgi:hypothetical protein
MSLGIKAVDLDRREAESSEARDEVERAGEVAVEVLARGRVVSEVVESDISKRSRRVA